jgi:hypothetical protein
LDPHNLAEEGKKGSNLGDRGRYERKQSGENDLQGRRECYSTLELRGKLRRNLILDVRSHGHNFPYKLINEADE